MRALKNFRPVVAAFVLIAASSCTFGASSNPKVSKNETIVRIAATPSGCPPNPARVPVGNVEVIVSNLDAPTVSEIEIRTMNLSDVLGEKENLVEGLSGAFSIDLASGSYVVNCPGAAQSHWQLVATARAKKPSA